MPDVERCERCGAFQYTDGQPVADVHRSRIRPYPPERPPESPGGWFKFTGD